MYAASTAPPRSTAPRIGEWLSESFNLFGRQWQVWTVQGLIYFFVGLGPVLIGLVIYYGAIMAAVATTSTTAGGSSSSGPPPAVIGGMFAGMGGLFLGGLLSTFLSLYFMCGMERTAAKQLRGEPIAVGDLFTAGDVYLPALGATIITGFLVTVGAIFCYVPGLLLAGMFSLVIPIIVEERVGVMEAIGKSWEATKPHMWMYLVWYLLISLILSLGASVCYIGMVATIPIYSIAMMVAYRDVFGIPGAVAPAAAVPIVPTASYGPAGPPVAASACPACHRPVAAGAVVCPYCSAPLTGGPQQPGLPPHA